MTMSISLCLALHYATSLAAVICLPYTLNLSKALLTWLHCRSPRIQHLPGNFPAGFVENWTTLGSAKFRDTASKHSDCHGLLDNGGTASSAISPPFVDWGII